MFRHVVCRTARSLAFVAALVLTIAQPVAAGQPTISKERDVAFSFSVADCGGFQIVGTWLVNLRTTTYFDQAGTPIREAFAAHYHGVIENSATGKSIRDSGSFTNQTDLVTGTLRSAGVTRHDTAPHTGVFWLDAGLVVFDAAGNVTRSTPHTLPETAEACAYFAA